MAWKKVILGDGTSSQFIKGDGSLDSYTYALGSSAQNGIISYDNRTTNDAPNSRSKGLYVDFKLQSTIGLTASGTYSGVLTFRSYGSGTDLSGGPPIQIAYANDGQLYTRYGNGGSAWYSWNKIIIGSGTSSQYIKGDGSFGTYSTTDSTKLPLSGGTLTGSLTTNGQIYSSSSTLQIRGAGNTPIIYGVSGATYLYAGNNTTTALTLQAGYAIAGSGFAYGAVNNYTKIIDGASGALTGTTGTFSGNVGIGNTSPASALTIDVADGQNKKALHITQNDAGEWTSKMDTSGYGLLVRSTANDTTPAIQIQGNGTSNNILTGLSNGKVGIGTTSPNAPLTLKSSASPIMLIQNADGNQQIQINANTTSGAELDIYDHASTGRIRLSARSGGDSFINTAGSANFGIGTASPSELLHVSSTGYNSAGMKIYGSKNSTLYIDKAVDGWDAKIEFQTAGTTLFEIGVDSTPGDGFFKIGRSDDNADFVINSSGKVGIGTTSPSSKLNIVYAAQTSFLDRGVLSESYGTPAHFKGFTVATADGTEASPTGLVVGEQIGGLNFLGYDGTKWRTAAMIKSEVTGVSDNTNMAAEIQFYTGTVTGDAVTGNYTGLTKRMVIDSSGNVGIGTTGFTSAQRDGNAKLDVMGGINLEAYRKINFDGNGYSVHGYINLQTLDSVPKMGYYAYYGHRVKNATGSIVQFGRGHASLDTGFYGNVGIGTTTPSQKLDVQGWIATTTGIINSSARIAMASNGTISLQNAGVNRLEVGTSGQLTVTPLTGGHVSFNNNSVDANFNVQSNNVANMLFVDGGADRVGIGTGSPAYKLEVKASVAGDWISRLYNESATGKGVLIRTDAPASADALAMGVYADSGYKMVVRSTGNVGIGTTSPTNSTDYNTLDIRGTNGGQIIAGRGAYQDFFMYTNTSAANIGALNDLAFKAGTTGSMSTPSLYLKDGGNVGIGTASPTSTRKMTIQEGSSESAAIHFLDSDTMDQGIVGNARGTNDIVTGTANNDFVVGSTYSRPTHIISNEIIGITLDSSQNTTFAGDINLAKTVGLANRTAKLYIDVDTHSSSAEYTTLEAGGDRGIDIRSQSVIRHYVDNANRLALTLDASANATFAGKVGIGVAPSNNLTIRTDANEEGLSIDYYVSNVLNRSIDIYMNSSGKGIIQKASAGGADNDLAINPNGGNVGIGTASPTAILHIGAGTDSSAVGSGPIITNAGTTNLAIRDSSNNVELLNYAYSGGGIVGTVTNHSFILRTNNTNAITINTSQNATFAGGVTINEGGGDNDFRIESDHNENILHIQANGQGAASTQARGRVSFGSVTGGQNCFFHVGGFINSWYGGGEQSGVLFNTGVTAHTSDSSGTHFNHQIYEGGSGTHPMLAGVKITAPGITTGGATATNAASLYITGAPSATVTGGNYAIYAPSGTNYFGGNVGIGTSSPGADYLMELRSQNAGVSKRYIHLHNDDTTNDTGAGISFSASTSENTSQFTIDYIRSGTLSEHTLQFQISGTTPVMTMGVGGNVGIGTDSPNARLEIEDNGTTETQILKITADDQNPYGIVVGNDTFSTTDYDGLGLMVTNSGVAQIDSRGTSAELSIRTGATPTEAIRIDSSQNATFEGTITSDDVTINGSTNYSQLTIRGGSTESGIRFKNAQGNIEGWVYANSYAVGFLDEGGHWTIKAQNNTGIYFYTNNSNQKMQILNSGNVSIGNTNDTYKLDVSGTSRITGNATFGGTVYATEYDLPSGGRLDWANGDARIVEGLVNNYSLSFQTYDGSNITTALRLDGNNSATFAGQLNVQSTTTSAIGTGAVARFKGGIEINSENTGTSGNIDALYFRKGHTLGADVGLYDLGVIRSFTSNGFAGGLDFYTGKSLGSGAYGATLALKLDESQNATFSGNVGVGINPTTYPFQVDGHMRLESNGRLFLGAGGAIADSGSNTWFIIPKDGANKMLFKTANVTALSIDSSQNATFGGNVTLGNTGGSSSLTIKASVSDYSVLYFGDVGNATVASVEYDHNINKMYLKTSSLTALALDTSQNATFEGDVKVSSANNIKVNNTTLNGIILSQKYDDTQTSKNVGNSNKTLNSFTNFVAPSNGTVMYEIQVWIDGASSKLCKIGVASNSNSSTVVVPARRVAYVDESDQVICTLKVMETGLTAGTTYSRWAFGITNSATESAYKWGYGGTTSTDWPPLILTVMTAGF